MTELTKTMEIFEQSRWGLNAISFDDLRPSRLARFAVIGLGVLGFVAGATAATALVVAADYLIATH